MSILFASEEGWLISHENLINSIYTSVEDSDGNNNSFNISATLFNIAQPFVRSKYNLKRKSTDSAKSTLDDQEEKTINHVKVLYQNFRKKIEPLLHITGGHENNKGAIELASKIYHDSGKVLYTDIVGANLNEAKSIIIKGRTHLFPKDCEFYCKDVAYIKDYLSSRKYDIIVLDPPWWNKYIRRKRKKTTHGYEMMFTDDLKSIPIEDLLKDNGFIIVWCTNSKQHLQSLCETVFSKWKVHLVARLFWLKITKSGDPVCNFSQPPGKQPFEQIIFASKNPNSHLKHLDGKLVVSVPSALHSHKPPLTELVSQYLPESPSRLEIFARYLLPQWTSWGLEAIRFQHESLYVPT